MKNTQCLAIRCLWKHNRPLLAGAGAFLASAKKRWRWRCRCYLIGVHLLWSVPSGCLWVLCDTDDQYMWFVQVGRRMRHRRKLFVFSKVVSRSCWYLNFKNPRLNTAALQLQWVLFTSKFRCHLGAASSSTLTWRRNWRAPTAAASTTAGAPGRRSDPLSTALGAPGDLWCAVDVVFSGRRPAPFQCFRCRYLHRVHV